MSKLRVLGQSALLVSLFVSLTTPVLGQTSSDRLEHETSFFRDRNIGVMDRVRPEYASEGIQTGAWIWDPTLRVGVEFNDNIYASSTATQSDVIYTFNPSIEVETTWSRHGLTAFVSGQQSKYSDFDQENAWTSSLGAAAHFDPSPSTRFDAGFEMDHLIEPRMRPGSAGLTETPIEFDTSSYFVAASQEFSRSRIQASVAVNSFNYDDGIFMIGGAVADQDFRDLDETVYSIRGDWALREDRSIFIRLRTNNREHDLQPPAIANTRDSSGYMVDVGADFDIGGTARGYIGIGYNEQDYDNPAVGDLEGFGVDGEVEWYPTRLTTITLRGSRFIEDSPILTSNGYTASSYSGRVDHELLRNLVLSASLEYEDDDYLGIDRVDERWTGTVGATWFVNRNVGLSAEYRSISQSSTGAAGGQDFDINTVGFRLTLRP